MTDYKPVLNHKNLEKSPKENEKLEKVVLDSKVSVDRGVNFLDRPEGLPVFQELVADEIGFEKSTALWIDSKNQSSTYALSSQQGENLLDKVKIARAFTPFQHFKNVSNIGDFIGSDTELLVLPEIDYLYTDDQISKWEAIELFEEMWEKVIEITEKHCLKVLTSLTGKEYPEIHGTVLNNVENKISVEETGQGLSYSSGSHKQFFYGFNGFLQTTLDVWSLENFKNSNGFKRCLNG